MKKSNIYSMNLLSLNKKPEILTNLSSLHENLINLSQEISDRPTNLKQLALQLISPKIIDHNDKDIRLLSSCCIADILRVFAPEAPYSDSDMVHVFEVLIAQLRGLATYDPSSAISKKVLYILSSLANVKSCVVPVILSQTGVRGADELVNSMFDAIISSIRVDHTEEIMTHCSSILIACIEESEDLNQEILDTLLLPLLPSFKTENPTAFKLCGIVLRRTATIILNPMSQFINRVLVGSNTSDDKNSELEDHIYELIFELHRVSKDLLIKVIPNICEQLKADEESIRAKAVRLLGKLFSSPHADYGVEFCRNFRDFVTRLNDQSSAIRLEMVESCTLIWRKKPLLQKYIEESLSARLKDPDGEIRLATVLRLSEILFLDLNLLSIDTIKLIGDRASDKKPEVRKAVVYSLARVYSKYVSSKLPPLSSLITEKNRSAQSVIDCIDDNILDRLRFIPSLVINSWCYPEITNKHNILQTIQEQLLSKGAKPNSPEAIPDETICECRASAVLLLFQLLNSSEKEIFLSILTFKFKVRNELKKFLDCRKNNQSDNKSISSGSTDSSNISNALKKSMIQLTNFIPSSEKASVLYEKLNGIKDKHVFNILNSSVEPIDNISKCLTKRDDLTKKLDSKTYISEYFSMMFDFSGFMIINKNIASSITSYLNSLDVDEKSYETLYFLSYISKQCPAAFCGSIKNLSDWLDSCITFDAKAKQKNIQLRHIYTVINVIYNVSPSCLEDSNSQELVGELLRHTKAHDNPEVCIKLAEIVPLLVYQSIGGENNKQDNTSAIVNMLKYLLSAKKLNMSNKRLACDLATLSALVKIPNLIYSLPHFSMEIFSSVMKYVAGIKIQFLDFVKDSLFNIDEDEIKENIESICMGLRSMTFILASEEEVNQVMKAIKNIPENPEEVVTTEFEELIRILFDCIESEGEMLSNLRVSDDKLKLALFETASICAMNLTKIKLFATSITVGQWHSLGFTLLNSSSSCKEKISRALFNVIQLYPTHPKFLTYPCLLASDELLGHNAEGALKFAIKRSRSTYEALCSRIVSNDDKNLRNMAHATMPENVLPYLLHLLSYHPEFPTSASIDSDSDKKKLKSITRSIKMMLTVLNETLRNDANNISFLLKQLNLITQYHIDKWDTENVGLQLVSRVALSLINENIKTSDNVAVYPGDIFLPQDLYLLKDSRDIDESLDISFEKAVQLVSKGSKIKYISSPLSNQKKAKTLDKHKSFNSEEKEIRKNKRKISDSSDPKESAEKDNSRKVSRKSSEPVEVPTRALPSRRSKEISISYKEPEETEKEVKLWDERVAEPIKRKSSIFEVDKSLNKSRLSHVSVSNKIVSIETKVNHPKEIESFDLFNSQTSDNVGAWNLMISDKKKDSEVKNKQKENKDKDNNEEDEDDDDSEFNFKSKKQKVNNIKKGRALLNKESANIMPINKHDKNEKLNKTKQSTTNNEDSKVINKKSNKKNDKKVIEKVVPVTETIGTTRRGKPLRA